MMVLLAIFLIGFLIFVFTSPFWLVSKTRELESQNRWLRERINGLELRVEVLEKRPAQAATEQTSDPEPGRHAAPAPEPQPEPSQPVSRPATPPPLPVFARESLPPESDATPTVPEPAVEPAPVPAPAFNFEQFLGVKLFAWLGGLVLFLAVAFYLKYAFDHDYITPPMRVAGGVMLGLGLIVGALKLTRDRFAVTIHALCASGVLVLYADFFAAHTYYKLIPSMMGTFALMALVTAVAFALAVRLNTQVVAILGLLGGFLTPVLLSTGEDRPAALFGYLALLNIGLMALAARQRWQHLVLMAAAATAFMEFGWVQKFFTVEKWFTAMGIFLFNTALFLPAFLWSARRPGQAVGKESPRDPAAHFASALILMAGAALAFGLHVIAHPYREICAHPVPLFTYVFLADLALLAVAWLRTGWRGVQLLAGGATFLLLAIWSSHHLTLALLHVSLAIYLFFAILHSVFPVVLQRLKPGHSPAWWAHLFPCLALVLVLFPMFRLETPSFLLWPVVLLIDALALLLAVMTASVAAVATVLLCTMAAIGLWIFRVPVAVDGPLGLTGMLVLIGGFGGLFFGFGVFAMKRLLPRFQGAWTGGVEEEPGQSREAAALTQITSLGAILPFLLLTLVVVRLPLTDPSAVFGLAALLGVMLLGVLLMCGVDALAAVALGCTFLLQLVWHSRNFGASADSGWLPLWWHAGFALAYLAFPFLFLRRNTDRVVPWAAAALSLPLHFALIHQVCKSNLPDFQWLGLVPALCALPPLAGLFWVLRQVPADAPGRNTLLALFGGVTLFFVTLVFPIQFEKQWLTVAWALEGVALLWLFHRVPHAGLRVVGAGLLAVAFVRLGLNLEALRYYERSGTPVFNWHLYSHGIVAACLFAGARLLHPPRHRLGSIHLPAVLYALGTVLAFELVNIEVADYFSTGRWIVFWPGGNLAFSMTYTLAWGLFAFLLLVIAFQKNLAGVRRAGLVLMSVTVLKLFLSDLWYLKGLTRVGAFVGSAIVLMLASFIYQKVLAARTTNESEAAS